MTILQKGTRINNPSDIIVIDVPVAIGNTTITTAADPRLIGGRVVSCEIYPSTDIAKISSLPTISSTGVVTLVIATATATATAKIAIALVTGNNV